MKRFLFTVLLLTVAAAALSGCKKGGTKDGKNGGDVVFNPDKAPNQDVADIFKKVLTDIYGDGTTPPVDTPESKGQVNPPQEEVNQR